MQKEKDPELRGAALLSLAQRLEASKRFNSAAQIYAGLERGASPLAERARRRLQVLAGSGTFGDQAEFAFHQLVDGIADPAALVAMGAAGAAYRMIRLAALSRLIAAPGAGLLTRGLGARALASTLAFAAEGAVFPAAHAIAARTLEQNYLPAASFAEQTLASYCALGGLRLAAMAGRGAARALPLGAGSALFQQGTMLGGILLGSGLERALDLKVERPWSATLAQALMTLLHFNASASLFRSLSGPRFQAWERGLDFQTQRLGSGLPAGHWATQGLGAKRLAPAIGEELVWKMANGEEGGKPSLPAGPVSSKRPAEAKPSAPVSAGPQQVLEFAGTLDVTTDLLKRQSPIVTALGNGSLRLKIQQSAGGWPIGFLANLTRAINSHLVRRGLAEGAGEQLIVELHAGGKTRQTVRLNKVGKAFVLANDSQPAPPREPGSSPFVMATNLLKAKPEAPPQVPAAPKLNPETPMAVFDRELEVEVNYIRQGMGARMARMILRETYPADFFERRHIEIGLCLQSRSHHMMVPLGFKVIFQIGEGESPREVVFIKSLGGYRKEVAKPKI